MGGTPPGGGDAEFPKNPTPQQQQKIIKDIIDSLEGKDRNEQNTIINKFKPIQKELWDKYNDYQFEAQKDYVKKQKAEVRCSFLYKTLPAQLLDPTHVGLKPACVRPKAHLSRESTFSSGWHG
jgi:hypothetical protein